MLAESNTLTTEKLSSTIDGLITISSIPEDLLTNNDENEHNIMPLPIEDPTKPEDSILLTTTEKMREKPPILSLERQVVNFTCADKPCDLYPKPYDCSVFTVCAEGREVLKHCNGGQLFDSITLECQPEEKATCWEPPFEVIPDKKVIYRSQCKNATSSLSSIVDAATAIGIDEFNNATNETSDLSKILSSPVVTNWGSWLSWTYCQEGTYVTGIYVWKRLLDVNNGQKRDLAGIVSLSLRCQKPDGTQSNIMEAFAPNVPNDGWPSYFTCEGVSIGFQMNSQKNRGSADDVATDNVQIICSCGPPKRKPYELITGPQGGNQGDWTEPQFCNKFQAICGMQTQMQNYRESKDSS